MKPQYILIPAATFLLGALVMYAAIPAEPKPAADLLLHTTNSIIYIPVTKEKVAEFSGKFLQITGISLKGR